ncbi:MAG: tetratricopeptide repeat protein, partial [Theionarchaea archaeon]|nr:tetratricopeptide repeat protein [Theionarchaea archaeon]
ITLGRMGKHEEALACYEKALEIDDDAADWFNKGAALGHLHRYEDAVTSFNECIKREPKHAEAWYNKGVALEYLKKYEEAAKCFDEASRINPALQKRRGRR